MQEEVRQRRKELSLAFAKTLKHFRNNTGKTITLISDEINLSKTIWADAENGIVDVQFSTFWRIVEALDIAPEVFICELKKHLPEGFDFIQ